MISSAVVRGLIRHKSDTNQGSTGEATFTQANQELQLRLSFLVFNIANTLLNASFTRICLKLVISQEP